VSVSVGIHADRLRELITNDLHKWVQRYLRDPDIDANAKVVAIGVFANAKRLLETTADLVAASEPPEVPP